MARTCYHCNEKEVIGSVGLMCPRCQAADRDLQAAMIGVTSAAELLVEDLESGINPPGYMNVLRLRVEALRAARATYNNLQPRCAMPGCIEPVGYREPAPGLCHRHFAEFQASAEVA